MSREHERSLCHAHCFPGQAPSRDKPAPTKIGVNLNGCYGAKADVRECPLSTHCGHRPNALLSVPPSFPASRLPQEYHQPSAMRLWEPRLPAMGCEAAPTYTGI